MSPTADSSLCGALEIDPDQYGPKGAITHWLGIYGRPTDSVKHGREILASDPQHSANIGALIQSYVYLGMVDGANNLIAEPSSRMPDDNNIRNARISLTPAAGDNESFIEIAEEEFHSLDVNVGDELNVEKSVRAYRYAWALLMKGENQQAADYFYWIAGEEDRITSKTYDEITILKMLALVYRRLDRIDEARALLEQCKNLAEGARDRGWATPSLYVRLAEVYAIGGDVEGAVRNLEIAYAKGWRELQDNPEINRIKVLIYEDLELQRQRL